jgi:hypothetical protein
MLGAISLICDQNPILFATKYKGPAGGKSAYTAKMNALAAELTPIRDVFVVLDGLLEGRVNQQIRFDEAPLMELAQALASVHDAAADSPYFVAMSPEQINCAREHLSAATTELASVASRATTLSVSVTSFIASAGSGFE